VVLGLLADAESVEQSAPRRGHAGCHEGDRVGAHSESTDGRRVLGEHRDDRVRHQHHGLGTTDGLLRIDEPVAAASRLEHEVAPPDGMFQEMATQRFELARRERRAHAVAPLGSAVVHCISPMSSTSRPVVPTRTAPSPARSIRPIREAPRPWSSKADKAAAARSGATMTTMPIPRLKTAAISSSDTGPSRRIAPKMGGTLQVLRSTTARAPAGRARPRLAASPPPVTWATAWIST